MRLAVIFALAAVAAMLIYGFTRLALGRKANYLVGGLIFIPVFMSPWWIALPGALAGHAFAVWVMNRLRPLPSTFKELTLEDVPGTLPLYEKSSPDSTPNVDRPIPGDLPNSLPE